MNALQQTGVVFARQMRPTLRNPAVLIASAMIPVLYLALFGPLLTSLPGELGERSWQWFVPGVLVMIALTSLYSGFAWMPEMHSGSHERLLAAPVPRGALLLGRILRDPVVITVQALAVIAIMIPFGLRLSIPGAVAGLALLLLLGLACAGLSYGTAMAIREEYAFNGIVQAVFLPVLLLSGIFLPMDLAPDWLYAVSQANPITHIVEAQRALFAGDLGDRAVARGTAAALVLAAGAVAWSTRMMRRDSA